MKSDNIRSGGNVQRNVIAFFCYAGFVCACVVPSAAASLIFACVCAAADVAVAPAYDRPQSTYQKQQAGEKLPISRYRPRQYRNSTIYDYITYPNNLNNSIYNLNDPLLRTYYPQAGEVPGSSLSQGRTGFDSDEGSAGYVVPGGGYDIYDNNGNKVGYVQDGLIYDVEGKVIGHTSEGSTGGFMLFDKKPRNRDASGKNR